MWASVFFLGGSDVTSGYAVLGVSLSPWLGPVWAIKPALPTAAVLC